jgi:hypothetical protein
MFDDILGSDEKEGKRDNIPEKVGDREVEHIIKENRGVIDDLVGHICEINDESTRDVFIDDISKSIGESFNKAITDLVNRRIGGDGKEGNDDLDGMQSTTGGAVGTSGPGGVSGSQGRPVRPGTPGTPSGADDNQDINPDGYGI